MDYPFEGIPTVPPRKDMDHMVCRASRLGIIHIDKIGQLRNLLS